MVISSSNFRRRRVILRGIDDHWPPINRRLKRETLFERDSVQVTIANTPQKEEWQTTTEQFNRAPTRKDCYQPKNKREWKKQRPSCTFTIFIIGSWTLPVMRVQQGIYSPQVHISVVQSIITRWPAEPLLSCEGRRGIRQRRISLSSQQSDLGHPVPFLCWSFVQSDP